MERTNIHIETINFRGGELKLTENPTAKSLPARVLYGWDNINKQFVAILVDADGKLEIMVEHNGTSTLILTEEIILDDEEKTTTYAETGETGLLLGEVALPAPKNHQTISFLIQATVEAKSDGVVGDIYIRLFDGASEFDMLSHMVAGATYVFSVLSGVANSDDNVATSLKGNTLLKLRIYLVGTSGAPNVAQYCRNCVLTIVPLYKS